MKKICIITDTLRSHSLLKPLIDTLQADPEADLTVLATYRHSTRDIELSFASIDAGADYTDQSLEISVAPGGTYTRTSADQEQQAFAAALRDIDPEIVVLFGHSFTTFSAAVAAFLSDIPVAHIQGGESDYGVWDDAHGFGITKIANLHFTATETYRRRVVGFGEHPDRVFNVGDLSVDHLLNTGVPGKEEFCTAMGFDPADEFIFVSMTPDRAIGSRNRQLMKAVTDALENPKYAPFKILCEHPGPKGFAQIMQNEMEELVRRHPGRVAFISDEAEIIAAMTHCRAIVGNTDRCVTDAAALRTPVVLVGDRLKDRENPGHMVPAPAGQENLNKETVDNALAQAICPEFKIGLMFLTSPFEQDNTPGRIAGVLRAYTRADIAAKTQYNE
ncbi:MAG: UDP-N-acetylglucosamine 2-epimerase [Desulfobacterales bacterium]|nr:UDP-N-acetylglucosamine 2-epimerase [Desulfobacterales bacterium]